MRIIIMNMCGRGDKDLPTIMPIIEKDFNEQNR